MENRGKWNPPGVPQSPFRALGATYVGSFFGTLWNQPSRAACDPFENMFNWLHLGFFLSKNGRKIVVEIGGVGPVWRAPGPNSASRSAKDVQNGWMATLLVTESCDLGSLGVLGPSSTPVQALRPWRLKTLTFLMFFKGWGKIVLKNQLAFC